MILTADALQTWLTIGWCACFGGFLVIVACVLRVLWWGFSAHKGGKKEPSKFTFVVVGLTAIGLLIAFPPFLLFLTIWWVIGGFAKQSIRTADAAEQTATDTALMARFLGEQKRAALRHRSSSSSSATHSSTS